MKKYYPITTIFAILVINIFLSKALAYSTNNLSYYLYVLSLILTCFVVVSFMNFEYILMLLSSRKIRLNIGYLLSTIILSMITIFSPMYIYYSKELFTIDLVMICYSALKTFENRT